MNQNDRPVALADRPATAHPDPHAESAPANPPAMPRTGPTDGAPRPGPENQLRNGASWFYWIAGLSVVNTAITLLDGEWGFVVGLGATQVIDALAHVATVKAPNFGFVASAFAVVLNLMVAGMFVLFGWLANARKAWAFLVGMALYAADGALFALVQDWLSVGFHAFVLMCIFTGYQALKQLGEAPATD